MRTITRTIYGAAMNSALYLGKGYIPPEHARLNMKFGIQATTSPDTDLRHAMQYYCIGNGGHRVVSGADGIAHTSPNNHLATDAACFNHVPFVLREVTDDLSIEERARYALRRQETHNGREYFAYYAKRIDLDQVVINHRQTSVVEGSETTRAFTPTSANLNPRPLEDSQTQTNVITASGDYVSASAVIEIPFNRRDADEFRNVARILYGDERYAVISEIAMVAGIDRTVTGPGPGNTNINYTEALDVIVTTFISTYYQLNMQNNGFTFTADVGITEPLFAIDGDTE